MTILIMLLMIFGMSMVGWAQQTFKPFLFNIPEINPDADILIVGDAILRSGFVALTSGGWANDFCTSLVCKGQLYHGTPATIPLGTFISSFSTKFTFSVVKSREGEPTGDGFVFFLGKHPKFTQGEANGRFGLFPNDSASMTNAGETPFFGIEFDTIVNGDVLDVDDNHLGVDINSAISLQVARASDVNVLLNNGKKIVSWIDWSKAENRLEARISYDNTKPTKPLLNYTYNLNYSGWTEIWTGFSASSSFAFEQRHLIHNWAFKANFELNAMEPQSTVSISWKILAASIVGGIAVVIISWCLIVKFTDFGKRQHAKFIKLLPPKCQETIGQLVKKKKYIAQDDDGKSISTVASGDDSGDQEDDKDENVGDEEKHNNDKPLSLRSSTPPSSRSEMLPSPPQSKIKHSHLTSTKSKHLPPPLPKLMHSSPPR